MKFDDLSYAKNTAKSVFIPLFLRIPRFTPKQYFGRLPGALVDGMQARLLTRTYITNPVIGLFSFARSHSSKLSNRMLC